ncbi:flagellar type III secretion system pore protein FliP [bacterium]|nr:flagellar type III secretion system pore protein FliP [bacterium]
MRTLRLAALVGLVAVIAPSATAQVVSVDLGSGQGLSQGLVQLIAVITILSLAPSILVMTTSFVRIVVVLSLLRTAIGLQNSPPNSVIISLALFLTGFVMAPTLAATYTAGVEPFMAGSLTLEEALPRGLEPVKAFMATHVSEPDLALFVDMAKIEPIASAAEAPFHVLAPAFMISELKRAFEIGFMIFLPFLVIDLVVASILMSMGMMMVPPVTISLPFKLIFFVLVDGWRMLAGSLVESFIAGPPT